MFLTGLILAGVGVLILVVGAVTGLRIRSLLSTAAEAQGKVVGFIQQSSGEGGTSKHAQVEFTTAAGETVTFTEASQTVGGLAVGSEVPVKYNPAQPKKARIATGGRLWVSTIVLVALGAVLLIVGVILGLSGG